MEMEMEMETEIGSFSSSFFPWDLLPVNLQESILSLLPISTLIRCTAVSRSLRSLIRSPTFLSSYHQNYQNNPQPLFLFANHPFSVADAYDPLLDRWTCLPISASSSSAYISSSSGPLLLLASPLGVTLYNPFSSSSSSSSSSLSPIIEIPSPAIIFYRGPFYPIALIPETLQHFKIVMANTADHLSSLVYDSKTGGWEMHELDRQFAFIANGSILNGLVYCLSRDPDLLLTFDPAGGRWEVLDVCFPAWRCLHILVYNGRLFLVGGVEKFGVMVRIGIWEMDWGRSEWRAYSFMPEEVFVEFSRSGSDYFEAVDRKGMICFLSSKRFAGASILMCDLSGKRWWWPRACERKSIKMHSCFVYAVEPYVDLVRGSE